jgi:hypothetical protein
MLPMKIDITKHDATPEVDKVLNGIVSGEISEAQLKQIVVTQTVECLLNPDVLGAVASQFYGWIKYAAKYKAMAEACGIDQERSFVE